jgi:hypothetical protein
MFRALTGRKSLRLLSPMTQDGQRKLHIVKASMNEHGIFLRQPGALS